MERKMFDFCVEEIKCVPGGSKEACVIAREYLQNCKLLSSGLNSPKSAVTTEEFVEAIRVLMASAWENRANDSVPERWYCESDCSNIDKLIFCPGEYQLASQEQNPTLKLCPHYRDSWYV